MSIVYLNGEYLNEDEAKISIFDRGFILADGIYEVLPIINSKTVDYDGFWDRFVRSLKEIKLEPTLSKEGFRQMFKTLIEKNNLKEGNVYTQITRGVAKRAFPLLEGLTPTCVAFVTKSKVLDNPLAKTGIKVASVKEIRWKRRDIKSISLLAQCMAKEEAIQKGAYEGFMVEDGYVTEGVSSTAYIVKGDTIITSPLDNNIILPGVRRRNLFLLIEKLGYKLEQRQFTIEEAKAADEVFISSATLLVMPVIQIDKNIISNGKVGSITKKLREAYIEKITQEVE